MGSSAAVASIGFLKCVFQTHRPSNSADLASWVGAMGSIGAIIGAWIGIQAQLRGTETLARNAAETAMRIRHGEFLRMTSNLNSKVYTR